MRHSFRIVGPAAIALAVTAAITLAACTPSAPAPTPAPTSPAPVASATPESTPPPEPAAAPLACDTVLEQSSIDQYALHEYRLSDDFAERAIEQGWPEAAFVTWGGLLCQWGYPNSDASEYYGLSQITPEHQATIIARLVAEGFSRAPHADGELYVGPPTEGILRHYFFAAGYWYVGFSPTRIDEIRRGAGLS